MRIFFILSLMATLCLSSVAMAQETTPSPIIDNTIDIEAEKTLAENTPEHMGPPPTEWVKEHCDPIRKQIIEINQRGRVSRLFSKPRVYYLKKEYYDCVAEYREKEYIYLKNASVLGGGDASGAVPELENTDTE